VRSFGWVGASVMTDLIDSLEKRSCDSMSFAIHLNAIRDHGDPST
jgi:hypothetical protein